MAQAAERKWKYAQEIQGKLHKLMKDDKPTFIEIDNLIHDFRIASQDTIFLDLEFANNADVGKALWDAHIQINNRFRKYLDRFRKGDQKQLVVERRKMEKRYVDFIKTSQFFYKGYIQRLASHFGGMPALKRVAHCLHLSLLSVEEPVVVSKETSDLLEASCHAVLLRLGDLSRYRNMIKTKDRSWDSSLAYYFLANDLCPKSGGAHNQMAVIALADQNHLDAVYHLYRAATAIEPHPLARGNLQIEFKKIIGIWEKQRAQPRMDSLTALKWWFSLLHSKFYEGAAFSTHQELENEVISRLSSLLQDQSIDGTLEKLVLVNIAAQYTARNRVADEEENVTHATRQFFFFCLHFNIRTMHALLQALLPELDPAREEILTQTDGSSTRPATGKFSATARRVLPALRQYGIWLSKYSEMIGVIKTNDGSIYSHIVQMWSSYAEVLTKIMSIFQVYSLASVPYLLDEDESTIGFAPLRQPELKDRWNFYSDGTMPLKRRVTDFGIQRQDPDLELESRVLDIIICGLTLATKEFIPLRLGPGNDSLFYSPKVSQLSDIDPMEPSNLSPVVPMLDGNFMSRNMMAQERDCPTPPGYGYQQQIGHTVGTMESSAASDSLQSMDTDMRRMVDDLLDSRSYSRSDETSYGMHSATANGIFAPLGSNGYEYRIQSTPKMLPSLPGLYTSAFTPQANELTPSSPSRPITARQLSPISLSTEQSRFSAAATLDNLNGFGTGPNGSWGRRASRPVLSSVAQTVNQTLQESLARQFMATPSSFADSSGLHPDATQQRFIRAGTARASAFPGVIGTTDNNSTTFASTSNFDREIMLQSSLYNRSQTVAWNANGSTPPGGQAG